MSAPNYEEFNKFQTFFYTDINKFNSFSNFEIKRNSVQLLTNIAKEFPKLAMDILNIYSVDPTGVKAIESPAIIKALQQAKFVTGFSKTRIPQSVFYKNMKPITVKKKTTVRKKTVKGLEFSEDIISQIQSILFLDNKDYEQFKYTDKVQELGKQIVGESISSIKQSIQKS